MIGFRDFAPRQLRAGGFFQSVQYETFEGAVAGANEWIQQEAVQVINIETVVLPNMWTEEGTGDPSLSTLHACETWHQFVRVWYKAG